MEYNQQFLAKGSAIKRLLVLPLLFFAWFAPHKSLRVLFHKLRGVNIGKNVEIGYFCIIGNVHPNMIFIEDCAVITARVTILEHDNSHYYTNRGNVRHGTVTIGRRAFIGIGSVIMPCVKIGHNSIVGALSFVNRDVPDNSIVCGNPARPITYKKTTSYFPNPHAEIIKPKDQAL